MGYDVGVYPLQMDPIDPGWRAIGAGVLLFVFAAVFVLFAYLTVGALFVLGGSALVYLGARMGRKKAEEVRGARCSACGAEFDTGQTTCPSCGALL